MRQYASMWSNKWAPRLAADFLADLGSRWAHVKTVGGLAEGLVASGLLPREVAAAAWLHDLGYAPELTITGFHPLDGATYLQRLGAPPEVVGLVGHHTGAAYEAEERGLVEEFGALSRPDPASLEALTLIDLVTAPDGSVTTPEARIEEILRRYDRSHPVHRAVTRSRDELMAAAAEARARLGLSDVWPAVPLKGVLEA